MSSILSDIFQGFPYPENIALSSQLESIVRANGGIPATIGILRGVARIGFQAEELIELLTSAGDKDTIKVSRRDLGYICGLVLAHCTPYENKLQGLMRNLRASVERS